MGMNELAQHILAVGKENNIPVTNLALQKVMYYTLKAGYNRDLLTKDDVNKIYDNPFLVWKYGPVVKDIYEEYRVFGADNIIGNYQKYEELNELNNIIISLLKINITKLVNSTHQEEFWKNNSDSIQGYRSNIKYPVDKVLERG